MKTLTAKNSAGYATPAGITVDAVVFTLKDGQLSVLLARRNEPPFEGEWALPGGFQGPDETPEETVTRKLLEKTGLPPVYSEQLRFYGSPTRDERGWLPSVAYLALVPSELLPDRDDVDADWHPVTNMPTLPFDHGQMVADGLERLRGKLWYSNIAVGLLPARFTLTEARSVYQTISGNAYDANNFRRRLQNTELVRATGKRRKEDGRGRPGELYEFIDREPTWGRAPAGGA